MMRKELDDLLCERYPLIFANRHSGCMQWGFSCKDGWFDLIDTLCERLQFWADRNKAPQVVATQVKEKFGYLCFYVCGGNDEQKGMIRMAEGMSGRLCECCGKPGTTFEHNAWWMTRCEEHSPDGINPIVGRKLSDV